MALMISSEDAGRPGAFAVHDFQLGKLVRLTKEHDSSWQNSIGLM